MTGSVRTRALAAICVFAVACGSAPPPDGEVVVRVRVRDDLDPVVAMQVEEEPAPLCDASGPDGLAVVHIAGGHRHGCVVTSDARVRCWGANWAGQLGDHTYANNATPTPVRDVEGARAVDLGRAHSCALTERGDVYCWGSNDWGQLGAGSRRSGVGPRAVQAQVRRAAQVSAGWDHACAVTDRGQVLCWGRNHFGQLGDGSREMRSAPAKVRGLRASHVGAGVDSTCAVAIDGRVSCWGALARSERPVPVAGLPGPAVSVEVGEAAACARMADGAVYCWGDGSHGLLGSAVRGASDTAVLVEGLPPVTTLSLSDRRACATAGQGELWCWGSNQPGIAEAGAPRVIGQMTAVASAAPADEATCARLVRGGVCCWGDNGSGMLGAVLRPFGRPSEFAELPVPMAW